MVKYLNADYSRLYRFTLVLILSATLNNILAQSDENHVLVYTAREEGLTDLTQSNDQNVVAEEINYFDGLGRPVQTVIRWGSPQNTDLIQPVVYDSYGREIYKYLPYAASGSNGFYRDLDLSQNGYSSSEHYTFYTDQGNKVAVSSTPYSETVYESSPLNRVFIQGAVGEDWQIGINASGSGNVHFSYQVNSASEVKSFSYLSGAIQFNSYYEAGELMKQVKVDENSNPLHEFTDKRGRVVLKRLFLANNVTADTYYVYGDDNLLYSVIPPELSDKLSSSAPTQTELNTWAFQYTYDNRRRMITKKVPGAEPIFMVYDNRDRIVLSQDGEQRKVEDWHFTKYDQLNRPIITGLITLVNKTHSGLQNELKNISSYYEEIDLNEADGYTDMAYPNSASSVNPNIRYLTYTYYDNYDYANDKLSNVFEYDNLNGWTYGGELFPSTPSNQITGQITTNKIRVLYGDLQTNNLWITTVSYFDDRGRLIQSIVNNDYSLNYERISTLYNISGWTLSSRVSQSKQGQPSFEVFKEYEYDHQGRLLKGFHEVFEQAQSQGRVLIAENVYNALGELVEKNLHVDSNGAAQSIDYRYNIRGWLSHINQSSLLEDTIINPSDATPDYFGMDIFYNEIVPGIPSTY